MALAPFFPETDTTIGDLMETPPTTTSPLEPATPAPSVDLFGISAIATPGDTPAVNVGVWSTEEHERYLQAKFANPKASWKEIAQLVGTRSARQVILHDQKFRAKMERRRSKTERFTVASVESPSPSSVEPTPTDLRYFDSMGILLLASVASSSRSTRAEAGDTIAPVENAGNDNIDPERDPLDQ
jgi:hypothetical protein